MSVRILAGDCRDVLRMLPDESVHCVVTSPPYWGLRSYDVPGAIGLEPNFVDWLDTMTAVFREVRRVLRSDGVAWVNMGDCYANDGKWGGETGGKQAYLGEENRKRVGREKRFTGLKPKDLVGQPWELAFAMRADGWWLRRDIIWHKPNSMPESITDRPHTAHEYIFLFSKAARYWYDAEAIREPASTNTHPRVGGWAEGPGSHKAADHAVPKTNGTKFGKAPGVTPKSVGNEDRHIRAKESWHASTTGMLETRHKRSVWSVLTAAFRNSHFATYPPALIEPCILAGCPRGGTVLDPFGGAGTTGLVADRLGRDAILIELNPAYAAMADRRIRDDAGMFAQVGIA